MKIIFKMSYQSLRLCESDLMSSMKRTNGKNHLSGALASYLQSSGKELTIGRDLLDSWGRLRLHALL